MLKPVFTTIEQGLVILVMGQLSAADSKMLREVVGDVIGWVRQQRPRALRP